MSAAAHLLQANADLWPRIVAHPFVAACADGTLPAAAFDRWLVQDHAFVVGFRRFVADLLAISPDEDARDLLASGLAALTPELELFRGAARERGLDLDAEPCPTALGYTAFVQAAPADGFTTALTVLYGAEQAYLDAWAAVREHAAAHTPYRAFIDNWSSPAFAAYVTAIAGLLDRVAGHRVDAPAQRAFRRVVRFELRFWDAVHAGEAW